MRLSRLVTMTVSSLALAAGGIFAVSAVTPASAATTTASPPQTHSVVLTGGDWGWGGGWGGWGGDDWGGWGGWGGHGDWGGWGGGWGW
jgi:hypothetical protein